jgi:cathepsin B
MQRVTQTYGTLTRSAPLVQTQFENFKAAGASTGGQGWTSPIELPLEFDGRQVWKNYLSPIRTQGKCGNCWAISTTDAMGDRFSLFTLGQIKPPLAACYMTICEYDFSTRPEMEKAFANLQTAAGFAETALANKSCTGNSLYNAARFMFYRGVPFGYCCGPKTDDALNDPLLNILQQFQDTKDLPLCEREHGLNHVHCSDGRTAMHVFRARTFGSVLASPLDGGSEDVLKYVIYKYGPVAAGFDVYPDFLHPYDGKTIYQHNAQDGEVSSGGHAVRVVGWGGGEGTAEPIPYWIIANSWGPEWGDNGYFKMKRVCCNLERNVVATLPALNEYDVEFSDVAKIVLTKDEKQIREAFVLDKTTKYPIKALPLIEEGRLKGDLHPIINYAFTLENLPGDWYAGRDVPFEPPAVPQLPAVPIEVLLKNNGLRDAPFSHWRTWVFGGTLVILLIITIYIVWKKVR